MRPCAVLVIDRGNNTFWSHTFCIGNTVRRKATLRITSPTTEQPAAYSPQPDFPYCCIFVTRKDKIKAILGDEKVWSILQGVVGKYIGFRRVKQRLSVLSITLCGYPFREGQGTQDSVLMKMMSVDLMQSLYKAGWVLVFGSNLSRTDGMVSWFFRRRLLSLPSYPETTPTDTGAVPVPLSDSSHFAENFLVVGVSSTDAFQIINAPSNICDGLVDITKQWYRFGIKKTRRVLNNSLVVKLNGNPWMTQGVDKLAGQMLILHLIAYLESQGYHYYGAGDLKSTTDTLFFRCSSADSESGSSSESSKPYHYLMISLEDYDRLCLINTTQSIIVCVRSVLEKHWGHGLKDEGQQLCAYEFILRKNPWWSEGQEAVAARKLLAVIFDELSVMGYTVMSTLDLSRRVSDKSAFVLKALPHAPKTSVTPLVHICISMSSEDKMRLIHIPTKPLLMAIRNCISQHWPQGIVVEGKNFDSYEVRLDGSPWSGSQSNTDSTQARIMMTHVLDLLERLGWQVVTSADVSAKYHAFESCTYPLDVDAWYLAKPLSTVMAERTAERCSSPADEAGKHNDLAAKQH